MGSRSRNDNFQSGDGASPGKIFIGGLHKDTTNTEFNKHFGKYGEITDSVIMRDRHTGLPRGFGFITFADPSVVDQVIEETHIFNGKQVEIKRTIPKGAGSGANQSKDFKTKKIFVGGIPSSVTEDELKDFFAKYGTIVEHQIIRDHETNRSRGFGFVIFDSEEVVDELLSKGNMIDMADTQVEIKKAEPKKSSNRSPPYGSSHPRGRSSFNDSYGGGYGGPYGGFDGGYGPPPGPIRSHGGPPSRFAGGYGYGRGGVGPEFGGGYGGGYGGGSLGYRSEPPLGYSSRFGPYGSGFGGEGYGGGGGYGRGGGEGYGGYGGPGYGGGFESGGSYEGGAGGPYGRGYSSSSSRYHPYGR
ncbi:hypothetical protein N665_2449s0006 [Sinapis alba]|nr:hypothetical protein N665_2449s0006 [Sinapis alba]